MCVVAVWELFGSPLKVVDAPLMMVVVGCPRFQLRHRNALFINGTDAVDDKMILFLLKIYFFILLSLKIIFYDFILIKNIFLNFIFIKNNFL